MKKIFIIHGWTYSTEAWEKTIQALKNAGFDPIQLTVPGLTEKSSEVWTLEKYSQWLSEKLKGEQDVILIGHSNGARISIVYTARHPDKISKLILIGAAGIVHNDFSLQMRRAIFGNIAKIGKTFTSSPMARKIFYRLIGSKDYERAPENMRETMKNMITTDLTAELEKISVSSLIIWGEKDRATPIADAHMMHELIKGSKLYVIPDAGHSPHKTHPEKVITEIISFIK